MSEPNAGRPWSEADDAELRGRVGWQEPSQIAQELGRSAPAVITRLKRLGLRRDWKGRYSAHQVGAIFNYDEKSVRRWLKAGDLRGRRLRSGASGYAWRWEIQHEDIVRFIQRHPARYERRRITEPYWRKLADQAASDVLLTAQAARLLGVNRKTIVRHLQRGWLAAERIRFAGGWAWQIRRADLATFAPRRPWGQPLTQQEVSA